MQRSSPLRVPLLEVDPDLGTDLSPEAFREAQRITLLPGADLPRGSWKTDDLLDAARTRGTVFGCVVVSGLIARDVKLTDRRCTQICGPGDFLSLDSLDEHSVPVDVGYAALSDARVGLLDDHFLAAAQRFPRVAGRLFETATHQLGRLSVDQAISQLPRVEDRLLALFWQFADRWGTRAGDSIRVSVPLTHESLGTLIGARRPTVSLGLRELAEAGWLARDGDTWTLAVSSMTRLSDAPRPRARRALRDPAPRPRPLPDVGGPLAGRVAALHLEVAAGLDRAARTVSANREIRERIGAARAGRAKLDAGFE